MMSRRPTHSTLRRNGQTRSHRWDWEELQALPIVDVAKKLGLQVPSSLKIRCFIHKDRTPSLSFETRRNMWKCFGCGEAGGPIKLVMSYLGVGKVDAVAWLRANFGPVFGVHTMPEAVPRVALPRSARPQATIRAEGVSESDPEVYEWLIARAPLQASGREHLDQRRFTAETVAHFRLGQMVTPTLLLREAAREWSVARLVACGLMKQRGGCRPTWWDNTLLIPFLSDGKVVYLQGRRLSQDQPKYVNLTGVAKPLFNADVLATASEGDLVLICEGATDAIAATQLGYRAVGVLGAHSFRAEWVPLFDRVQVAVVPDVDEAGALFEAKVVRAFRRVGRTPDVLSLTSGKDVAEYLAGCRSYAR